MSDSFAHPQLLIQCQVDGNDFPLFAETGYYSFVESMDLLYPVGSMEVQEARSVLISGYPLLQASEIDVYCQDDDANKHFAWYPFNSVSTEKSGTKDYTHKISLISRYAFPISLKREYYSDYCTASDYVRALAGRLGLRHDIEDTKQRFRWICPGWRVGQMLRHLAQHAVSVNGYSGYVYYVTYDGVLTFRSMDSFFEESSDEEQLDVANLNLDVNIGSLKRKFMSTAFLGSNKVETDYFDVDNERVVASSASYSDYIQKRALKIGLSSSVLDYGLSRTLQPVHTGHRDDYPHEELPMYFRKATAAYESTIVELVVKPNPFGRRLGDVVNITFPGEPSDDHGMPFSGRYLITKVNTVGTREFYQRLTLARPGVNLIDRDGAK